MLPKLTCLFTFYSIKLSKNVDHVSWKRRLCSSGRNFRPNDFHEESSLVYEVLSSEYFVSSTLIIEVEECVISCYSILGG